MGTGATTGAAWRGAVLLVACLGATACTSQENLLLKGTGMKMEDPAFYPSDDSIRQAKVYFRNENYGLAAQAYQKAVEQTPKDAEAWLGLAASYDHLRRFDLADQAYERVLQLGAKNATILNNAG